MKIKDKGMTYTLYYIVKNVNGGGIIPKGEPNYDREAFKRMEEIEELIDMLIKDMMKITEKRGWQASVYKAKEDALSWFEGLKETAIEVLERSDKE